jgi:hypothetical protein
MLKQDDNAVGVIGKSPLLKDFRYKDRDFVLIDPPNLKEYFRGVEKGDRNLQDLLSHVLIRRTRNQIIRFYGYDAKTHQKVIESGKSFEN